MFYHKYVKKKIEHGILNFPEYNYACNYLEYRKNMFHKFREKKDRIIIIYLHARIYMPSLYCIRFFLLSDCGVMRYLAQVDESVSASDFVMVGRAFLINSVLLGSMGQCPRKIAAPFSLFVFVIHWSIYLLHSFLNKLPKEKNKIKKNKRERERLQNLIPKQEFKLYPSSFFFSSLEISRRIEPFWVGIWKGPEAFDNLTVAFRGARHATSIYRNDIIIVR